jgi:hypothetical protein
LSSDDYITEPGYPAPWTTRRPREALRDNDEARIICLAPDVCRAPKVPVPFMIHDTCGHDANYTPSVRFTGQKAMVLRSNTTHVHGDEPGVGKGVKSGTVGGICEPIGHASQVRAEGSHVIRHLDRFWMNNRNTVGEALFVRDTATYRAPEDDDPVPGSLRLADMSSGWALSAQAQAAPAPNAGAPVRAPAPAPAPRPPGQVIRPDIPQWRRPPPTSLPSPTIGARLGRLGRFGGRVLGLAGALLWPSPLADGTLPNWYHDLQSPDPFRRRTAEEAQRRFEGEPALRPQLEEWFRDETFDRPHVTPTEEPAERPATTPRTICRQYGMQAHHIVPDWTLRVGNRADGGSRIPNMPSLNDGMAICVMGQARVEGDEHNEAHFADGAIEQLGLASTPPYTATVAQVVAVSSTAMKAVRPDCAAQIDGAIAAQYTGRNPNQLLRAKQYPPLPAETVHALRTGVVRSGSTRP